MGAEVVEEHGRPRLSGQRGARGLVRREVAGEPVTGAAERKSVERGRDAPHEIAGRRLGAVPSVRWKSEAHREDGREPPDRARDVECVAKYVAPVALDVEAKCVCPGPSVPCEEQA